MAKDSSRTTAAELQKKVEFRGQKTLKKISNSTYITTCCLGGFQEKKNQEKKMLSSKHNLQHIQLSDTTGTSNGTGFYGQMKLKNELLAANTQDGFGEQRDKKVPHVYNEIYCCIFNVVGLYFFWRSWTSCLDTWHHGFYQIPTDKKSKSD